MAIDFYTSYSQLSNVELLKIILQKDLYQKEAVGTAEQILQSREITEQERVTAENDIAEISRNKEEKKERQRNRAIQTDNFIRGIFMPENKSPAYIIRLFCIAVGAIWLYQLAINFGTYASIVADISLAGLLLITIEVVQFLMLYLLFRLNRKGWMLLMIYYTFILSASLYSIVTWHPSELPFDFSPSLYSLVIQFVFAALVLGFFNRRKTLIALKVRRKLWIQAAGVCAVFLVLCFLIFIFAVDASYYFS